MQDTAYSAPCKILKIEGEVAARWPSRPFFRILIKGRDMHHDRGFRVGLVEKTYGLCRGLGRFMIAKNYEICVLPEACHGLCRGLWRFVKR